MRSLIALAGILHTLSCQKNHPDDMRALLASRDPTKCYFYLEASMADGDQEPDHQYWKGEAEKLCSQLRLSPDEVLRLLPQLLEIKKRLAQLLDRYPSAQGFCHLVLFDERL